MPASASITVFAPKSGNVKITGARKWRVSTTYAPIEQTCPDSCALRRSGECYALGGHVFFTMRRIEAAAAASGADSLACARSEAIQLDAAFRGRRIPQDGARGGRDLRLHTSGDCRTRKAARALAAAARRWRKRGGGDVWTYTHGWRDVPRSDWRGVSVLASLDSLDDVAAARAQGYAVARYVASFASDKAWREAGITWIPCPAQTREASGVGCADCRLCMSADKLAARNAGIAFEAHGMRASAMKRRLTMVA